jgi:hypothetical protein
LPRIPAHQRPCFLSRCLRSNGASNAAICRCANPVVAARA